METIVQGNPARITAHVDAVDRDGQRVPIAVMNPRATLVGRYRRHDLAPVPQDDTPEGRTTLRIDTPADLPVGPYDLEVTGHTPSGTPLRVYHRSILRVVLASDEATVPPAEPEADITVAMQALATIECACSRADLEKRVLDLEQALANTVPVTLTYDDGTTETLRLVALEGGQP